LWWIQVHPNKASHKSWPDHDVKSLEQLKQTETRALALLDNGTNHAGLQRPIIFTPTFETVNHFTCFPGDKKTEKETYGGGGQSTAPSKTTALLTTPKAHNQTSKFLLYKPEGKA